MLRSKLIFRELSKVPRISLRYTLSSQNRINSQKDMPHPLLHRMDMETHKTIAFSRNFSLLKKSEEYQQHDIKSIDIPASDNINKEHAKNNTKITESTRKYVVNLFSLVEEVSHMDDVRMAQAKVMDVKDALQDAGERKRDVLRELTNVGNEIHRNHADICTSIRGTDREHYINLVKEEGDLLKREKDLKAEFSKADDLERILFRSLTSAINDSYEKEKVHSNLLKTWGLIGTLFASVVTLIGSFIGHYYHNTKFGLVAFEFKENVNQTIKSEIGILRELVRSDLQEEIARLDSKPKPIYKSESWGSYMKRHGWTVYRWVTFQK